jgi:DNA-binding response OmpR family regulator
VPTPTPPPAVDAPRFPQPVLPPPATERVEDDRDDLEPGDARFLIVEDDPHYARVLLQLARSRGFKGIVAMRGAEALALAREYRPNAISLDIFLPDMLGWTVLSQLKHDHSLRHIPVQIVTLEEQRQHGLERGAFAYLNKPVTMDGLEAAFERLKDFTTPRQRELLIVEDDPTEQMSLRELLGHDDVNITTVGTGTEALATMRNTRVDCVVLDLRLPDITGFELLEEVQKEPALPCSPARSSPTTRRSACARWPRAS